MALNTEQPLRVSYREIVLAVKQRLVDKGVLTESCIFPIARNAGLLPDLQAPKVIFLRPRGFSVNAGMGMAGGRYTTVLTRILDVIIRVRGNRDKIGDDTLWLTKESDGYFALEESALDALHMDSELTDIDGNALVCEPIRIVDGTTPDKGGDATNPGWGVASFGVETKYLSNLDVSVQ